MACEEYLLQSYPAPLVMLWRNEPAVIIGKNQNARENVDFAFAERNNIKVVRRLTGGGAVFHDLGNVNYTFIVPDSDAPDSFSEFSKPIIAALSALGITAEASGRNDLLAGGKKFSGTARCGYIYNGRKLVMHHGTLLFSSDMSRLSGALITDTEKMKSKGIKSVSSRVVNLKELLPEKYRDMDAVTFMNYLTDYFIFTEGTSPAELTSSDKEKISALASEKYSSDKWLFGAGAEDFTVTRKKRFDFGTVSVSVSCLPGEVGLPAVISRVKIEGDFIGDEDVSGLENALCGIPFEKNRVFAGLSEANVIKYIRGCKPVDITELLFNQI